MRILSVGDIHTKIWVIDKIVEIMDNYDHIVFCGDFVDDWSSLPTKSLDTWHRMKRLIDDNPDKVHITIGNHDYAYIHQEIAGHSSGWNPITYTMINTPENKYLKDWLLALPVVIELDGVTFSHAGITENWNGEFDVFSLWDNNSPIWARPEGTKYKKIKQVMGHTPQLTCNKIEPNIWFIDTFSTYRDGLPIGDQTVLEIIDGEQFNKVML